MIQSMASWNIDNKAIKNKQTNKKNLLQHGWSDFSTEVERLRQQIVNILLFSWKLLRNGRLNFSGYMAEKYEDLDLLAYQLIFK